MKLHKFAKISLYGIVILSVFFLGLFQGWLMREILARKRDIYVYDTEHKIDAYFKCQEASILATGLPREDPDVKDTLESIRKMPPLVAAGPILVFFDDKSGSYLVREKNVDNPIVEYQKSHELCDRQYLHSKVEKGWQLPRFSSVLFYSKDGVFEKGVFVIQEKDGRPIRAYRDTQGTGIFDEMEIFENGIMSLYRLKGLSWRKVAQRQYIPELVDYEKALSIIEDQPDSDDSSENTE